VVPVSVPATFRPLVMARRGLVGDRFILHRHRRHVFFALSLISL